MNATRQSLEITGECDDGLLNPVADFVFGAQPVFERIAALLASCLPITVGHGSDGFGDIFD